MILLNEFPTCFPDNFEETILPKDAKCDNKSVYRVIKSGKIDRESFISTFEEIKRGLIPPRKTVKMDEPDIYSTSCFMDYSDAEYILKLIMRHYPQPFIAKGVTEGTCGPSQITAERKQVDNSHVDWWIYENSYPQDYFEEAKNEE